MMAFYITYAIMTPLLLGAYFIEIAKDFSPKENWRNLFLILIWPLTMMLYIVIKGSALAYKCLFVPVDKR